MIDCSSYNQLWHTFIFCPTAKNTLIALKLFSIRSEGISALLFQFNNLIQKMVTKIGCQIKICSNAQWFSFVFVLTKVFSMLSQLQHTFWGISIVLNWINREMWGIISEIIAWGTNKVWNCVREGGKVWGIPREIY